MEGGKAIGWREEKRYDGGRTSDMMEIGGRKSDMMEGGKAIRWREEKRSDGGRKSDMMEGGQVI